MDKLDRVQELTKLIFKFQSIAKCSSVINDYSFNELQVLKEVARYVSQHPEGGIRMSELSDNLGVNKSSVSQLVNRLEDRGLLERTSMRDDRRVVRVHLTAQGTELFEREKHNMLEFFTYVVERMGEEDADEMLRLVKKYYQVVLEYNDSIITGEG